MAQSTPSNVIDATALFAARYHDAAGCREERRALEIAARLHSMLEG